MTSCAGGGTQYTYAQLEGLWVNAGGQASMAPLMAAIAEAESGGCSSALNATDNGGTQSSYGLWQISTGTHAAPSPDWSSGAANAALAVAKYQSQGLGAWGTYTSGAYKAFLGGNVTPDTNVPGGAVLDSATLTAASNPDCMFAMPSVDLYITSVGGGCVFSKSNARALIGGVVLAAGGVTLLIGTVVLAAYGLRTSDAAKEAGRSLEAAGAAVALLPGAESAGGALAGAGARTSQAGQSGAAGRAAQRRVRRSRRHAAAKSTPVSRPAKKRGP